MHRWYDLSLKGIHFDIPGVERTCKHSTGIVLQRVLCSNTHQQTKAYEQARNALTVGVHGEAIMTGKACMFTVSCTLRHSCAHYKSKVKTSEDHRRKRNRCNLLPLDADRYMDDTCVLQTTSSFSSSKHCEYCSHSIGVKSLSTLYPRRPLNCLNQQRFRERCVMRVMLVTLLWCRRASTIKVDYEYQTFGIMI